MNFFSDPQHLSAAVECEDRWDRARPTVDWKSDHEMRREEGKAASAGTVRHPRHTVTQHHRPTLGQNCGQNYLVLPHALQEFGMSTRISICRFLPICCESVHKSLVFPTVDKGLHLSIDVTQINRDFIFFREFYRGNFPLLTIYPKDNVICKM